MSVQENLPPSGPDWFAEIAEHDLNPSQKAALADWLRESPTHVRELLQLTALQENLAAQTISADQIESWIQEVKSTAPWPRSISAAAAPSSAATRTRHVRGFGAYLRGRPRQLWLPAACLTAVVLLGALCWQWQDGRYTTQFGEQRIVALPDGSVVEINTNSTLKVRYTAHKRSIDLIRGEAFFRVAHDMSRPFVVNAGAASVTAVGTQFNVRIAALSTFVSVVDGKVEVGSNSPTDRPTGVSIGQPMTVTTGEEARITSTSPSQSGRGIAIAKATTPAAQRATAWTKGRVEFEATPLDAVLNEFRRYRDFNVRIDDSLRHLKLTGSFDVNDPESALAYIATLPDTAVEKVDAKTFLVRRRDDTSRIKP
jgi:transmembrane sensor